MYNAYVNKKLNVQKKGGCAGGGVLAVFHASGRPPEETMLQSNYEFTQTLADNLERTFVGGSRPAANATRPVRYSHCIPHKIQRCRGRLLSIVLCLIGLATSEHTHIHTHTHTTHLHATIIRQRQQFADLPCMADMVARFLLAYRDCDPRWHRHDTR